MILLYSLTKLRGTTSVPSRPRFRASLRDQARVGEKGEKKERRTSFERIRANELGAKTKFSTISSRRTVALLPSYDIQFARKPTHHHASAWYIRVERTGGQTREQIFVHLVNFDISSSSYVRIYIYVGRKVSRIETSTYLPCRGIIERSVYSTFLFPAVFFFSTRRSGFPLKTTLNAQNGNLGDGGGEQRITALNTR